MTKDLIPVSPEHYFLKDHDQECRFCKLDEQAKQSELATIDPVVWDALQPKQGEFLKAGEKSHEEAAESFRKIGGVVGIVLEDMHGISLILDAFMRSRGEASAEPFKGRFDYIVVDDEHPIIGDYKTAIDWGFKPIEILKDHDSMADFLDKGRRTKHLQALSNVPGTKEEEPDGVQNRRSRRAAKAKERKWPKR